MTRSATLGVDSPAAELVQRARAGEEAAFARLIRLYHGDLTRVCFVICGDRDLADEAVQSAWPIAWRKLGSLRDPDRVRAWLVSIAANEARQVIRHRKRRTVVEINVAIHVDGSRSLDDRVADLDLANALAHLSPEDRTLIALRYVAGLNSTELARAVGRTPSGTRSRLARVLARLRAELGDE